VVAGAFLTGAHSPAEDEAECSKQVFAAEEDSDAALSLLQTTGRLRSEGGAPQPSKSMHEVSAASLVASDKAKRADSVLTSNTSRVLGAAGTCSKRTGGTCLMGKCDASRGATCERGSCICKEMMCAKAGECKLSMSEVVGALSSGDTTAQEKLEYLANGVPGVADQISRTAAGAFSSAKAFFHGLTGGGECQSMVSTCVMGRCPDSTQNTATCSWGVCKCKPNFCFTHIGGTSTCTVDLQKLFGGK